LAVASVAEESGVPPPPATAAAVEEERTAMEMAAAQASLEPRVGAGSSGADVVVVPSDKDSTPPLPAGDHDVMMSSAAEHSPTAEVPEPSPIAGAVEPSSAAGAVTVEEVMELATH
jgi:hypothetical protein